MKLPKLQPMLQNALQRAGVVGDGETSPTPSPATPAPESSSSPATIVRPDGYCCGLVTTHNHVVGWAVEPHRVHPLTILHHYMVRGYSLCGNAAAVPINDVGYCKDDAFTVSDIPVVGKACPHCRARLEFMRDWRELVKQYGPKDRLL